MATADNLYSHVRQFAPPLSPILNGVTAMARFEIGTATIETCLGDLVTMDVDAIVNAANEALAQGGGVCGAIFRAAGPAAMQAACHAVAPCPTGQARMTPGFKLKARYVIHAVGPVWRGGRSDEPSLLASAYRSAIELASQNALASIAFPAISTGIYGYPMQEAAAAAVDAIVSSLRLDTSLKLVMLVFRDEAALRACDDALGLVTGSSNAS